MGRYLNPDGIGSKADRLIKLGAIELSAPPATLADLEDTMALVCVVDNGPFDAAGYAFDDREKEAFSQPDDLRPKRWLVMEKSFVEEHAI